MNREIRIQVIDQYSPHLEDVIKLGRAYSSTLGQMPKGGFVDHAQKKCILIALSSEKQCVGYLMYRISFPRACIVHLCVDNKWRGESIAHSLIQKLKSTTGNLHGLKLSCRRDYGLDDMWSSFGFTARNERPGKNKEGKLLVDWYLNYGHPDLLTTLAQQEASNKLCVVIDACVFYDLIDETGNREIEDSRCLIASWLESEVHFRLTDEIYNEINRHKNLEKRNSLRKLAQKFTTISYTQEKFEEIETRLKNHFPEASTPNDTSDLRHLARTIAADIKIFITRDVGILEKEADIYDEYGTSILRPSDLIVRLDELRREEEYQPVRLAGTSIEKGLVKSGQQVLLTKLFLSHTTGETKTEFQRKLQMFVASPSQYECQTVLDNQKPIALIVHRRPDPCSLEVCMLRVKKGHKLASTLLQNLLWLSIKVSSRENRKFTILTDAHLCKLETQPVIRNRFIKISDNWLKINLAIASERLSIKEHFLEAVEEIKGKYPVQSLDFNDLTDTLLNKIPQCPSYIERALFPAKVTDAEIPTFIVPIRPEWAEHLFDEELAKQDLFGAQKDIALRSELVYYRSALNHGGLKAPGRILWYVSQGKKPGHYYESKAIRACSRLDSITIDNPKVLFRQFRRIGIYKFNDVLNTAKGELDREIMALKFSDTEIFDKPIPLQAAQDIIGNQSTFPSPHKISEKHFKELYNAGVVRV